jgi:AAA domain
MGYGVSGSHGTGKSTLARAVAEKLGLHFLDASVNRFMKEGGFDGLRDLPMEVRIEAQEWLLKRYLEEIAKAPGTFITDRTPLDFIGYATAEVTMHNTPDLDLADRIADYCSNCLEATARHFDMIILVRPLELYEVDPKRPPLNRAYQWSVQYIIEGAMQQVAREVIQGTLITEDLEERINCSCEEIGKRLEALKEIRQKAPFH